MSGIEITRFTKFGGPLTKRVSLDAAGQVVSDGSACVMSAGMVQRVCLSGISELADLIGGLASHEALALGTLRPDLPDQVRVVTKNKLEELNGTARSDTIARTNSHIAYRQKQPAFALLDFDAKGMPDDLAHRIKDLGGFWPTLVSIIRELAPVARVFRRSTSAGLYRIDTGAKLLGSNGLHGYLLVQDGSDIDRFLKTLHTRCWLAGFGLLMVGAGGQLLERSIVDRMVGAPERLVFEGAPILELPLAQDSGVRKPLVTDGDVLDTFSACPPLSIVEQSRFGELRAKATHHLAPESAKAQEAFIREQAQRLAERTGMDPRIAARVIARQCEGVLMSDVELPFDEPELRGVTVTQVLADPAKYEGATLADPLEGIAYGRCKAKIMVRADGTPWIHSYAHGQTVFELRHSFMSAKAAIENAPDNEAAKVFVETVISASLGPDEHHKLRKLTAERAGVGVRTLDAALKTATAEHKKKRAAEERQRRLAERQDPRPELPAPAKTAEWLPVMRALNEVLGSVADPEPPMRDDDGFIVGIFLRRLHGAHLLTSCGANGDDSGETRLPPPEQPMLYRLNEAELSELIERYIKFVDDKGDAVHLAEPFVHHYRERKNDRTLPRVHAIATMPIVLADGSTLARRGLDRDRGIVFRIPPELLALLPKREACTPLAVGKAMQFLCDVWLVDVASDYAGKCVMVALALSILERIILPERPAFFITAGQRGGGKTTVLNMVSLAVLGHRASAAAWSSSD